MLKQQWDTLRNGNLKLEDFRFGSGKKVWWNCPIGKDHIWKASIVKRINGGECPVCAGRMIVNSNCLRTTNPELTKEWHQIKNGSLTPDNVYRGSGKKVWWLCSKCKDHEWEAQIKHRVAGSGCPICSNKKVVTSNSLALTHPDLVSEWHPTRNIDISPAEVVAGSDRLVWWLCKKNQTHEWQARINKRTIRKQGCPVCSGRNPDKEHNLATLFPEIAAQWNYVKNSPLKPEHFRPRSNKKVWWICKKVTSHTYPCTITNRVQGVECSICSGRLVDVSNSLQTLFPTIAEEWHPTKNGKLTPADIAAGTTRRFWWKCAKGEDHEWQSTSANRIAGKNCPVCEGLKVVASNCLSTTHPKLSKEWHPTRNENLTPYDVVANSHKTVWWKCSQNPIHEWRASVKNRSSQHNGCPYCKLTPQSKQELTIIFELKSIFPTINPKGHYFKHNDKKWTIDIFIPELKLGIEFDGSYWHRDKDLLDIQKNSICLTNGIKIIRIREHPLTKTSDMDIISSIPFSAKTVVDNLLRKIKMIVPIPRDKLLIINNYQEQSTLKAEEQLDHYVSKLFRNKMVKFGQNAENEH